MRGLRSTLQRKRVLIFETGGVGLFVHDKLMLYNVCAIALSYKNYWQNCIHNGRYMLVPKLPLRTQVTT